MPSTVIDRAKQTILFLKILDTNSENTETNYDKVQSNISAKWTFISRNNYRNG